MMVNGKRFFVQARLILHTYDTKAMEKILKFRSVTSQNCCPLCRAVYGTRNKELGNVIWEGCRYLLDYEHALSHNAVQEIITLVGVWKLTKNSSIQKMQCMRFKKITQMKCS
jgi:hypothetical protein